MIMGRRKLTALNITFLYVGTLMGAGFASGREIWQFFGVFGEKSVPAILIVMVCFMLFGMMTVKISQQLETSDIGKIILPYENHQLENAIGTVIAAILFLVYTVMDAAGGALFQEQFGLHRAIGSGILTLLVIITTLGGFERISRNFKHIIPILLIIVFAVCISIMMMQFPVQGREVPITISPLAPYWHSSAFIYVAYNMLGGIPILASCVKRARTPQTALKGAALGGLILGLAALIMNLAMLTDPWLSDTSVLPILSLSGKISVVVKWLYAVLLMFAVYSTATSNFFGFTTKLKDNKNKKAMIILAAILGFALSLVGFAEIIAIILPVEGYCGVLFLSFMTVHYIQLRKTKQNQKGRDAVDEKKEPEEAEKMRFAFTEGIQRVTAGHGGEVFLITGSEKTVVIDCGMAFCGEALVENIKKELGDRPLDYAVLTHTHYDHIAGLPYLRKAWPMLVSLGAPYAEKVLAKDSALHQIELLSKSAWKKYLGTEEKPEILMDGLKVDQIVCENDVISLGDRELHFFETPGHTNCSLTVLLKPEKVLFTSETIGVYTGRGTLAVGMLKSSRETMQSIEKCRSIEADHLVSPHYGLVPQYDSNQYWDLAVTTLFRHKEFVLRRVKLGVSFDKIMEEYTNEFYGEEVSLEQPKEAFLLNAHHMIHNLIKEFHE